MFKSISNEDRVQSADSFSGKGGGGGGLGMLQGLFKPGVSLAAYRAVEGENKLRILPPLAGDELANSGGVGVWTYYVNGRMILSPSSFKGGRDPIIDRYRELKKVDPKAEGVAKPFKASRRVLCYVLDCNSENPNEVLLWSTSASMMERLLGRAKVRGSDEIYPFDDPVKGCAIFFEKKGKGLQTRYGGEDVDKENPTPLSDPDAIEAQMKPFSEILHIPSDAEMQQLMADMEAISQNGESRDAPPQAEAAPPAANGKADDAFKERLRAKVGSASGSAETVATAVVAGAVGGAVGAAVAGGGESGVDGEIPF